MGQCVGLDRRSSRPELVQGGRSTFRQCLQRLFMCQLARLDHNRSDRRNGKQRSYVKELRDVLVVVLLLLRVGDIDGNQIGVLPHISTSQDIRGSIGLARYTFMFRMSFCC